MLTGLDCDPERTFEVVRSAGAVVEGLKRLAVAYPTFHRVKVSLPAEADQIENPAGVGSWKSGRHAKGRVRVLPGVYPMPGTLSRVRVRRHR